MCKKLTWFVVAMMTLGMVAGLTYGQSVNINFQKEGGDEPNDYLPDFGEVFADRGNGFSYGWNENITGDARDRNKDRAPDQRYDTVMHFSKGSDHTWEIELADGEYDLFIVCGDSNHTDQTNTLDVEGTLVVDENGQSDENYWDEYTLTVDVVDGRLTITPAEGADNAKICFIDITQVGPPAQATVPTPAEGAADLLRDEVVLSWTPGAYAEMSNVYVGASLDDVAAADIDANNVPDSVIAGTVDGASFAPGRLALNTTYFWRVDSVSSDPNIATASSAIWSFTIEPYCQAITSVTATASCVADPNAMGPEKTVDGSGLEAGGHSTDPADMWLSCEGEPTWIQYEFDKAYKLCEMLVWNYNLPGEELLAFGNGARLVTIETSMDGAAWTVFGDIELAPAPGVDGAAAEVVDMAGTAAKYVRLNINLGWGPTTQVGLSEVQFSSIIVRAREPQPTDGTIEVAVNDTLSWRAGLHADQHEVYISSNQGAVANGSALVDVVDGASLDLGPLGLNIGTTYYWKVNEVNNADTPASIDGDIWSFTTQDYFVIDDFEGYNGNIGGTWKDGWKLSTGVKAPPSTGSPAVDTVVAHSGAQSMLLSFDNFKVPYVIEVERSITSRKNWTDNGVKKLALSFMGDPGNSPRERLYVKINGKKITYGGDLSTPWWKTWTIDLAKRGINIRKITELSIGIGDVPLPAGGKGKVWIDDIRLYRSNPAGPHIVDAALALNGAGDFAGQFDTLLAAVLAADPAILEELSSEVDYTVLAPTDDAFAAFGIDAGNVGSLDPALLNNTLMIHVIPGKVMAADVSLVDNVGQQAAIVAGDAEAANGVIHAIDTMLLPYEIRNIVEMLAVANASDDLAGQLSQMIGIIEGNPDLLGLLTGDGEYTVFAPTDEAIAALEIEPDNNLFLYHIAAGTLLADDVLAAEQIEMLNGDVLLQDGGILIDGNGNQINLTVVDIIAANGVVHVIDAVLTPAVPLLTEDFESYEAGTDLHGVNGWEGWEGTAGAGAPVSDAMAVSGTNSVEIVSSADLVKILDITGGKISVSTMQYIPSGTEGDTFFILMNQYAPNPLDWSTQTKFSLGSGQINDGQGTIVYDEWVELKQIIDLDSNTVEVYYNGELLSSGQWDNDGHNTLQAIDLYSAGASSVYYDDIIIMPSL